MKFYITGVSLFFYGAAPFLYNYQIIFLVNPEDLPATISVKEG